MNRLTFLNIYEDVILDAKENAESLLREADDLLNAFEENAMAAPFWKIDLDGAVLRHLEETVNMQELTNSIVDAYFCCATEIVMGNPFFEKHGISFTYYANGDNSDIEVHLDKGDTEECQTYYEGTLTDIVRESIIDEVVDDICPLVEEYLSDTGREYPREWVLDDLREVWNLDDIESYIKAGALTEDFKETIDSEAREIEPERE